VAFGDMKQGKKQIKLSIKLLEKFMAQIGITDKEIPNAGKN
jgi:hypothetical protein